MASLRFGSALARACTRQAAPMTAFAAASTGRILAASSTTALGLASMRMASSWSPTPPMLQAAPWDSASRRRSGPGPSSPSASSPDASAASSSTRSESIGDKAAAFLDRLLDVDFAERRSFGSSLGTPYSGRSIQVQNGDVSRAYRTMMAVLRRDDIRTELRRQERYEKPNQERRRKRSERHRRRFADLVRKRVQLVMALRKQNA